MDKIFDDSELMRGRFICDCLDPMHSLDIMVEWRGDHLLEVSIWTHLTDCTKTWRNKLRIAWSVLRGKDAWQSDFYLRKHDIKEMIKILRVAQDIYEPTTITAGTSRLEN